MTQVVELYVVMYCETCAHSVKKAVKKIPGMESYKIDFYGQKVIVVGNVDRDDVWRRIHKTGRHVMLIVDPAPPKEEPKKEQKKEKKEEKKEEKKGETKSGEKTKIKVEEQKTEETKIVKTQEEVKVEEVVTVVETKKEEKKKEGPKVEEKREETKTEVKKKESERPKEPEWVPMYVSAPYYTLPNRFYNY